MPVTQEALVVFVDRTECPWLRLLARGFRHCFVLVRTSDGWLVCDPLKTRIELAFVATPPEVDPARAYTEAGHRVLRGRCSPLHRRRISLVRPLTCVEVVKRILGLHAPAVLTPRQLFVHLRDHPRHPFCTVDAARINDGVDKRRE